MAAVSVALEHLEDAETAMLSFIDRISYASDDAPDEEMPAIIPALAAVMRSIGHAAGALESIEEAGI